jgi:hypothetical protein
MTTGTNQPDTVNTEILRRNVSDTVYDRIAQVHSSDDTLEDWFYENVEVPVLSLICEFKGHKVIDDMCGKPEHRTCLVCQKPMPNQPLTDPT